MTKEELRIYNRVRFELLMEDAEWRTKDYLEMMGIDIPIEDFNFEDMAKQFEEQMTADNSESFVWTQIIEEQVSDIEWEDAFRTSDGQRRRKSIAKQWGGDKNDKKRI